eukprot:s6_g32.t1
MPEVAIWAEPRLVFGFGEGRDAYQEQQVVPPNWIFSDTHDSDVVAALREVGILEEQQGFWASIFPQSEMRAVQRLTACQRAALSNVRSNASLNHDKALPEVRERFTRLGYGEAEVQGVLGWIQDLAPMCIHIHLDNVGRFLETDEFYRSQFETGTSCGALDDKNQIRKDWETDLFGGAYDDAKAFERCKYGALGVMNDYRGITSAYQYGDSYLVLKDVRLRATFAATDSGGIQGSRLAVLDKYAHVLKEYNDNELHRLVEVAMANTSMEDVPRMQPRLLRGLTADTTNDWVTMGFPDLPQKKGRYFFEVELHFGCESPQVGLLSSAFEASPRTKGLHLLGVGDDQHGWGADGQHSILWHGGRKMAWNRTWKTSGRQLSELVVVSVAVDIEAGKIWFATNGDWDAEAEPSFGPAVVPKSAALYPAVSFKGRAAFNFGPEFKHDPPKFSKAFVAWPGMPDGKLRADCPIIGNSNNVMIYKEIQIHGEVSLKRNVQRLVANRKHLEMSKSDRTWAICVDGLGGADGTYDRVGAKNGKAWYKQQDGNCHQILFDADPEKWKIIHQDAPEMWLADAPPVKNSFEPPRHQWSVPSTKRGRVPVSLFKTACADAKISSEVQDHICKALGKQSTGSSEMEIFRIDEDTSFEDEWTKLQRENKVQMTAEDFWALCVKKKHEEILAGKKLKDLQVVESPHPYPAKTHSWTKDIYLPNASRLRVSFDPRCATLDDCTTFRAFSGGLSKSLAGVGARAHLKAISGVDQVHGTMAGQAEGGKWSSFSNSKMSRCHGGPGSKSCHLAHFAVSAMGVVKVEHSDLAQHQAGITQELRKFWMEGRLCDVVLKSRDGTKHRAHSNVLSAASTYFLNLLGGSFREADQVQRGEPVEIAASKAAVSALLDYIYDGQPEVPLETALELLRLAEAYDLPKFAVAIEAGISESLDSNSALQVLQEVYGLHSLKDACEEKVAENFETCSQHPDFGKLSAGQLARILKREDLGVSREEAVLQGIFTWLSISNDRHAFLGTMLQHVDFQSVSFGNLLRLGRFTLSGFSGDDLHREVDAALRSRKREHSSVTFRPKRRRLQHWSPDLGASVEVLGRKDVFPFPCLFMREHEGKIYAMSWKFGIFSWNHGDLTARTQYVVNEGTEVNGIKLGSNDSYCDFSISHTGDMFVLDCANRRLARFRNGSWDILLDGDIDADSVFCSPDGMLYILENEGKLLRKLVGSTLQTVVASETLPADLQFEAEAMFVTKKGLIYLSDDLNRRVLCIDPADPLKPVVVGEICPESPEYESRLWDLFVTEDGTIYVADKKQRRVLAFHPGNLTPIEVLRCQEPLFPVAVLVQDRSLYVSISDSVAGEEWSAGGIYQYPLPHELQLEA